MRQPALMQLTDPEWLDILRSETEKPGRSKAEIARELGISRTAVSLLCAGKYSAKVDKVARKIADKVMSLYAHRRWCPHLHASIAGEECRAFAGAPMSISDPAKLRHYRACRACPLNPLKTLNAPENRAHENEVKHAVSLRRPIA